MSALDVMGRGLFVTIEGGEGSGKSIVVQRVVESLQGAGVDVVATKEPGGSLNGVGERIRELLLDSGGSMGARTEALLMAADRAEHVETIVLPSLRTGQSVVCDRYLDSSVAYQGFGRGLGAGRVRDISLWATDGLLPDLTVLLDVDPRVGLVRRASAGGLNRLDLEGLSFHRAVRDGFLRIAQMEPQRFVVVDASRSANEVFIDAFLQIAPLFGVSST